MGKLLENGRLVWRLMQDPRVPAWLKVGVPLLIALYVISPIDFLPDFLVGPGELDDLGVVLLGMSLMVRLSPRYVVDEHKQALGLDASDAWPNASHNGQGSAIEGEYRVVPPNSK